MDKNSVKWWQDKAVRDEVLAAIAGTKVLSDEHIGASEAKRRGLDFYNRMMKLNSDFCGDAFPTMIEAAEYLFRIHLYNIFKDKEEVKLVMSIISNKFGKEVSVRYMPTYARYVKMLAKTLESVGLTKKEEVQEILPYIAQMITMCIDTQHTDMLDAKKLIDETHEDFSHDLMKLINSAQRGVVQDLVDNELCHLNW